MTKKKIVALALATSMILGGTPVYAQTVSVTSGTGSGSSPSSFTVTADMLTGGDLVVTIPDSLDLVYDDASSQFTKTSKVNVKGNINPAKKVVISTPTNITYRHEDDTTVTADGTVTFGSTSVNNQKAEWSATELKDGGEAGVDKDISSSVAKSEVEYIGTYKATINFNVSLEDKEPTVASTTNGVLFTKNGSDITVAPAAGDTFVASWLQVNRIDPTLGSSGNTVNDFYCFRDTMTFDASNLPEHIGVSLAFKKSDNTYYTEVISYNTLTGAITQDDSRTNTSTNEPTIFTETDKPTLSIDVFGSFYRINSNENVKFTLNGQPVANPYNSAGLTEHYLNQIYIPKADLEVGQTYTWSATDLAGNTTTGTLTADGVLTTD